MPTSPAPGADRKVGVMRLQANPLTGTLGNRRICAPMLGVGVYGGNATAGIGLSPSPSCGDGNPQGITALNLCSLIHAGCVSVFHGRKRRRGVIAVPTSVKGRGISSVTQACVMAVVAQSPPSRERSAALSGGIVSTSTLM